MTEVKENWDYSDKPYLSLTYIHPKDIFVFECEELPKVDRDEIENNIKVKRMIKFHSMKSIFVSKITTHSDKVFTYYHTSDQFARQMIKKIEDYHAARTNEDKLINRVDQLEEALAHLPGFSASFLSASARFERASNERNEDKKRKRTADEVDPSVTKKPAIN